VVVTRPTKWGNPHGLDLGRDEAVRQYLEDLLDGRLPVTLEDARRELRGRDLACYCPLDESCHADVLIAIANGEPSPASVDALVSSMRRRYRMPD
jgi:hypothetical protein